MFLCSRKRTNVENTVNCLREKYSTNKVGGCACNVGNETQLRNFLDRSYEFFSDCQHKKPEEIIINGIVASQAVSPHFGMTYDMDDGAYQKIMQLNLESYWKLVKLAKPRLSSGTSVIFNASVGGFMPTPPLGLYCVSKTALMSLARVLSIELGRENIRVNTIAPGLVRTKMTERFWKYSDGEEMPSFKPTSLPRLGEPVDIAGPVAFLLSDDSAYLTGETIVVSGGIRSRV